MTSCLICVNNSGASKPTRAPPARHLKTPIESEKIAKALNKIDSLKKLGVS